MLDVSSCPSPLGSFSPPPSGSKWIPYRRNGSKEYCRFSPLVGLYSRWQDFVDLGATFGSITYSKLTPGVRVEREIPLLKPHHDAASTHGLELQVRGPGLGAGDPKRRGTHILLVN